MKKYKLDFSHLIGKIIKKIKNYSDEEIRIELDNGEVYSLNHMQDCCESVRIEDIYGDLEDLLNTPILSAECVSSNHNDESFSKDDKDFMDTYTLSESYTWTFYKISTIKGSVTLRWLGTSNGYYSEEVNFSRLK